MKNNIFVIIFFLSISADALYADDWFKVNWVYDGDTILLSDGQRIRYLGINAPETAHDNKKAESYGLEAMDFNRKLVLFKDIRIELDKEQRDKYGRKLAYVFLMDGTFVNKKIIEKGYAYLLHKSPNNMYHETFLTAQQDAMLKQAGIWKDWKEKKGSYIGNQNSKRFHLTTCPYGKKTNKKNISFFHRKWDAFWEGYAPCKRCFGD